MQPRIQTTLSSQQAYILLPTKAPEGAEFGATYGRVRYATVLCKEYAAEVYLCREHMPEKLGERFAVYIQLHIGDKSIGTTYHNYDGKNHNEVYREGLTTAMELVTDQPIKMLKPKHAKGETVAERAYALLERWWDVLETLNDIATHPVGKLRLDYSITHTSASAFIVDVSYKDSRDEWQRNIYQFIRCNTEERCSSAANYLAEAESQVNRILKFLELGAEPND